MSINFGFAESPHVYLISIGMLTSCTVVATIFRLVCPQVFLCSKWPLRRVNKRGANKPYQCLVRSVDGIDRRAPVYVVLRSFNHDLDIQANIVWIRDNQFYFASLQPFMESKFDPILLALNSKFGHSAFKSELQESAVRCIVKGNQLIVGIANLFSVR